MVEAKVARIHKAEYQRRESYTEKESRVFAMRSLESLLNTDEKIHVRIIPEPWNDSPETGRQKNLRRTHKAQNSLCVHQPVEKPSNAWGIG